MKIKLLSLALTLVAASTARAQDLYLLRLHEGGGAITVDSVVRVTKHSGYDSQPAFVDNNTLLYTSQNEDGRYHIWRYDVGKRASTAVTAAAKDESEYSALMMPGAARISVVKVEKDSTQRLWSVAADGSDPRVLVEGVKGIAYYKWLDADNVVANIIADPSRLEIINVRTGARKEVAEDIGRTILNVPGRNAFSYVQNVGGDHWIHTYDAATGQITLLVKTPEGNEFYAWTANGTLLSAEGSVLYAWDGAMRGHWKQVADLAALGVNGISRLAVSPDGKSLVVVADD